MGKEKTSINVHVNSPCGVHLLLLIITGYALLFAWARITGWFQGDYLFFIPAARSIVNGSFDIYSHRLYPEIAPPYGLGYAYPPILAVLLAPFVALGDLLGLSNETIARYLLTIPLLAFDLLCVGVFLKVAKQLNGNMGNKSRAFLAVAILACPGFIVTSAYLNHTESLLSFFTIAGYGFFVAGLPVWSGMFFAFALMSKQTALFALLPVVFIAFRESLTQRKLKNFASFTAAIALPCLVIQVPFVIAEPHAAYYALVTGQERLIVGGDNLWAFILKGIQLALPAYGERAEELIRGNAHMILMASNMVLTGWIIFKRKLLFTPVNLAGIMALSSFFPVVLSKWGSSVMYKILPVLFLLLWDIGIKNHPWPLLSVGVLLGYGFFDALPVGVFPTPVGDAQLMMRALFKAVMTLGVMGYLYRSLIRERTGQTWKIPN